LTIQGDQSFLADEADEVPTGWVVAVNKTYVATASRQGQWWVITVEGLV
jgi:hypothetical protein